MKIGRLIWIVLAVATVVALLAVAFGAPLLPREWMAVVSRYGWLILIALYGFLMIGYGIYTAVRRQDEPDKDFMSRVHEPAPRPEVVDRVEAWLRERRGECIRLCKTEEKVLVGCTKAGGLPDMPEGYRWPLAADGTPMRFFMQLRCSDLAPLDPADHYPHSGMLYFFGSYFNEGLTFYAAEGGLRPQEAPKEAHMEKEYVLHLRTAGDYPEPWEAFPDCTQAEIQQAVDRLGDYFFADEELGQLGGYEHPEYAPCAEHLDALREEPEAYEPLLCFQTAMEPHIIGTAQYFIRRSDLADRYFAAPLFDWQD